MQSIRVKSPVSPRAIKTIRASLSVSGKLTSESFDSGEAACASSTIVFRDGHKFVLLGGTIKCGGLVVEIDEIWLIRFPISSDQSEVDSRYGPH